MSVCWYLLLEKHFSIENFRNMSNLLKINVMHELAFFFIKVMYAWVISCLSMCVNTTVKMLLTKMILNS